MNSSVRPAVTGGKLKVLILHNIINPHTDPLFEKMSNLPGVNLKVYFLSETAEDRKWLVENNLSFQHEVLPNTVLNLRHKQRGLFPLVINPTIGQKLLRETYDVLVCTGWDSPSAYVAFLVCKLRKKPFIMWSGTTANEKAFHWIFTTPLKKLLARGAEACIAYGTLSKEFLVALGADERKVFISHETVDIEFFRNRSALSGNDAGHVFEEFGIKSGSKAVLYVGQLLKRKGVDNLIRAYAKLRSEREDVSLLIVGYGPEEETLKQMCAAAGIEDVFFRPFTELRDLPRIYAASSVFVLPSTVEVWGLVLNEAMACGLPVISTSFVGASRDLIIDGVNGYVVRAGDEGALYSKLKVLISDDRLRERMGRESRRIIDGFTYDKVVRGFIDAFEFVSRDRRRPPSVEK